MKVVLVTLNYHPELTGIGKYSGELAEWFAKRGHEVRVITAPPYYPVWKILPGYSGFRYVRETINSVRVLRCPLYVPKIPTGKLRVLHLLSFAFTSFLPILKQATWRPDVIITIEPPLFVAPSIILASCLARSKAILHVQDFEVDAAFSLGIIRGTSVKRFILSIEKWLYKRFTLVSSISNGMLSKLIEKGINRDKTFLIRNWVDTSEIKPLDYVSEFREKLGFSPRDVVVLYSGNMGKKQGLELIIDVAAKLMSHTHIKFLMCGNGAARDELKERAKGLSNVFWLELQPIERLNALLNTADIHLLPQLEQAADLVMPSKLTGMLASGKAIIATAHPMTEVGTVVGECGELVPPGDIDALSSAVCSLASDEAKRAELGVLARHYAIHFLEKNAILTDFENDLSELTGRNVGND